MGTETIAPEDLEKRLLGKFQAEIKNLRRRRLRARTIRNYVVCSSLNGILKKKSAKYASIVVESFEISRNILKIGTLKSTCVYCECDFKSQQIEVNVAQDFLFETRKIISHLVTFNDNTCFSFAM